MVTRAITAELISAAEEYPVVTIVGPRQSGKTTLVRMTFPRKPYCSLEDPDIRQAAGLDPRAFLKRFTAGAVLDEIQRLPELISYLQGIVDTDGTEGRFILTGSHQPLLHETINQSLAGRTALLTLLPFSLEELKSYRNEPDAFQRILSGGYPRLHEKKLRINRFFNGYVQTYLERDVRSLVNLQDLARFQQFLSLLAGRIGQVLNYSSLGNDIGVSSTTVRNWISVLKASYIVFELQPWFQNIGKRIVKSPKLYFTDTGLASFLLGIGDTGQLKRDRLRGGLYENLVILEFMKTFCNRGIRSELYFYRDSHGNEVDLLLKGGSAFLPVEIKSAETFNESFLRGIHRFKQTVGADRCEGGIVMYNGDLRISVGEIEIMNPLLHGSIVEIMEGII
ncbi:MAG: ATP-binding protein [Chitinispirillaceae bacterium]|nr:ATP-binding protein [Chitinispirillaceae bacterium]